MFPTYLYCALSPNKLKIFRYFFYHKYTNSFPSLNDLKWKTQKPRNEYLKPKKQTKHTNISIEINLGYGYHNFLTDAKF